MTLSTSDSNGFLGVLSSLKNHSYFLVVAETVMVSIPLEIPICGSANSYSDFGQRVTIDQPFMYESFYNYYF